MSEYPEGLRTPLGRVRFLGSAKSGTREAWLVHVTAIALVPLSLYFVWLVLRLTRLDYNGVRAAHSRKGLRKCRSILESAKCAGATST